MGNRACQYWNHILCFGNSRWWICTTQSNSDWLLNTPSGVLNDWSTWETVRRQLQTSILFFLYITRPKRYSKQNEWWLSAVLCQPFGFWCTRSWTAAGFQLSQYKPVVSYCEAVEIEMERASYIFWSILYFFIPAILITTLNAVLAVQMNRIQRSHSELTNRKMSMK